MKKTIIKFSVKTYGTSMWVVFAVLAVLISACAQPTPEPAPVEPVVATPEISQPIARWNSVTEVETWVLIGYDEAANPTVVEPGTYVTINFSAADDKVTGSGGCNNYSATYTADDYNNLSINGPISSTLQACETGMEQESFFLGTLETVSKYTLAEDGKLLLTYDKNTGYEEQLVFVRGTPLVDTLWVLTAYDMQNTLAASQPGLMTTAIFSADGSLKGSGGCNQYSADFSIQASQIEIGVPASTRKACETGMEQEQVFLADLERASSYQLGLGVLEILTSDGNSLL